MERIQTQPMQTPPMSPSSICLVLVEARLSQQSWWQPLAENPRLSSEQLVLGWTQILLLTEKEERRELRGLDFRRDV